jgi:arylsulfatase
MPVKRPNIILIVLDCLRPDHLSCYGYHKLTSPNIDSFAEECVLFKSAFSASPSTVGSIPSILSGLYPSFHGTGVDGNTLTLSSEIPTLADVLKQEGYTTVGFNTNPYMVGKHGYDKGYGSYYDLFPSQRRNGLLNKAKLFLGGLNRKKFTQTSEPCICSKGVNERVSKYLKHIEQKPFFIWLHYMDTHAPYLPREPYFSNYSDAESKKQAVTFKNQLNHIYGRLYKDQNSITQEERQFIVNCYDSEIRYFDENLKKLLRLLRKLYLLDNTVIILTSDHGEEFWEHGKWGHYMRFYDTNIRVPLLIRFPHLAKARKTVSTPVRNIDIFPTILDMLNINHAFHLSGLSLLSYIKHEKSFPEATVFSEGGGVYTVSTEDYIDRVYSIRTPQWKYIKNKTNDQIELYNLKIDPMEFKNLSNEKNVQEVIKDLDSKLNCLLDTAAKFKKKTLSVEMESQIKNKLKALGYM